MELIAKFLKIFFHPLFFRGLTLICIFCFVSKFYSWITSPAASNCGSFLSGAGAFLNRAVTILVLIFGYKWIKKRRLEKNQEIAENLLNRLYDFFTKIEEWIKFRNFSYNKYSKTNAKKFSALSEKEKSIKFNEDEWEYQNYARKGFVLAKSIRHIKNLSLRFSDSKLTKKIEKLEKLSDDCVKNYNLEFFQETSSDQKIKVMEFFNEATTKFDELYKSINGMLVMYLQIKKL